MRAVMRGSKLIRLRTGFAWFVAIAAIIAVQYIASILGRKLGVPISLEVDSYRVSYGMGAEDELSSITTTYGWGVNILSVLAGIAIWHPVRGARVSASGLADFHGWLLGSLTLIVGGVPLWKAFSRSIGLFAFVGNLLDFGLTVLAVFVGYALSRSLKRRP